MKLFVRLVVALFAILFAFIGCTVDRSLARCSDGERKTCQCQDGTDSFKRCIDGAFEDCICDTDAISFDNGTAKGDSVDKGAAGDKATEKDNGKGTTSQADSGRVDAGFDTTTALDAESRPDSQQHDVASSEASVDSNIAETGGEAVRDSGEPSSGKEAGTDNGTDAGDKTTVYGQCRQGKCSDGQACNDSVDGGTFCSIPCEEIQDCPEPTSGEAVRRCSPIDGMCRLNCTNTDCSKDMECVGSGFRATCVFPQTEQTAVYDQCEDDACSGDRQCITVINGTGTYCSIPCETTEQCPIPASGTAERRCSTIDGTCRLDCQNGECPEGMECFEAIVRSTCVWEQDEQ